MIDLIEADVAVVGGGPAGLAAAEVAAASGLRTVIVDENPALGGQIWRRPADPRRPAPAEGVRFTAALESLDVAAVTAATVWAATPGELLVERAAPGAPPTAAAIRFTALVIATGAHDRAVPFPGWTLPGVWSAGGLQALAKAHGTVPGQRVVLAGAGPFLLPVASSLLRCGARVEAIVDATAPGSLAASLPLLARFPERARELARHLRPILAARIPIHAGSVIVSAIGDQRVKGAMIARADRRWAPRPHTERTIAADVIGVGYGFVAQTQLAELLGCELREDPLERHDVVVHGSDMQTSLPGIFVAGELTGVGGARLAVAEGRLAGAAAARHAGASVVTPEETRAQLRRERRFAEVLRRAFAPRDGLWELADEETIVCRCEDVTLGPVRQAVYAGARSVADLKLSTRVGMGPCQGRTCRPCVRHVLAREGAPAAQSRFGVRPPLKPVAMSTLLAAGPEVPGPEPDPRRGQVRRGD